MICPITDKPCRTNGCGEKCYKRDSLGYSTAPQHDAKLLVSGWLPTDTEIQEWAKKEAARWEKDKAKAVTYASHLIDGALWMRSMLVGNNR